MAAVITESEKISFHLSKERLVVMMVDFLPALRERWVKSSSDPSLSKEIYPNSSAITRSYFSNMDSNLIKVFSDLDSFN